MFHQDEPDALGYGQRAVTIKLIPAAGEAIRLDDIRAGLLVDALWAAERSRGAVAAATAIQLELRRHDDWRRPIKLDHPQSQAVVDALPRLASTS
jgi:hypothetical protein